MAPRSVLPGRVRFEYSLLIGQEDLCRLLEREVASIDGVINTLANRRTGRILVRFDEEAVSQKMLASRIENVLITCNAGRNGNTKLLRWFGESGSGNGDFSPQLAGQLLVDLMAHTFLPKPLDFLLPAAVAVLRRQVFFPAPHGRNTR